MIDPVTLAVLQGRLEQIADEMDATLFRSAFNPIIAEAHDASHGLYHAQTGETLIQGKSGLPIFVGAMSFAVKMIIDKAARDGDMADGDVYIFNDPYDGGTHLSDFKLVRPYYRGGEIYCYLASVGHWHDVGGNVPGNYNPVATESFQEGMLIPPVKLFVKGELRPDIIEILKANSRLPGSLYGDLNGQINALDLGDRRLSALLDEYGDDTVTQGFDELKRARPNSCARTSPSSRMAFIDATIGSTMTASSMRHWRSRSISKSLVRRSPSTSRARQRRAPARLISHARRPSRLCCTQARLPRCPRQLRCS